MKDGPKKKKRTRGDMHALIDADYFGYRDEDNGDLVKAEAVAEKKGNLHIYTPLNMNDCVHITSRYWEYINVMRGSNDLLCTVPYNNFHFICVSLNTIPAIDAAMEEYHAEKRRRIESTGGMIMLLICCVT